MEPDIFDEIGVDIKIGYRTHRALMNDDKTMFHIRNDGDMDGLIGTKLFDSVNREYLILDIKKTSKRVSTVMVERIVL